MKFSRNAILSGQILAAHKLRTLLSMTGIIVGVGSVILMVSIGRGAEKKLLDRVGAMGTDLVVVNAAPARLVMGRTNQVATVTTLTPADAHAIAEECPHVVATAPVVTRSLVARWEDNNTTTTVTGLAPAGLRIRRVTIQSGRTYDELEDRTRRRVAILGRTVADNLFGATEPVGQQIRISRVPFEVIGVTTRRGLDVNGTDQDDVIFVPLETAMRRLLNVAYIQTILVQARNSAVLADVEQEVRGVLRRRQRLPEGRPDNFTIQNQMRLLATERQTARSMTTLIGSVASIALLVGGVGIFGVMLISVRERVREIGLRRAVGARRRDIQVQFLVEAALLAGVGGTLGVMAGVAATHAASALGAWDTLLSWPAAAMGFLVSVTIGLLFGIYPAIRAACLEPIEALRAG